ncbi:hypothetical protein V5799_022147 [Amblyomma americanum]|uniref:Uncharacterized protein n=1 Tax=Amblyomma americanum TaxID=6943 RepID=A0AAQ4FL91_AMBAM
MSLSQVRKHPSIRVDEQACVAYGQDGDRFFSFEVIKGVANKVAPLLNATLLRDRTPCMALYNLELEDGSRSWSRSPERYVKMVDEVHALLRKRLRPAGSPPPEASGLWGYLFPS